MSRRSSSGLAVCVCGGFVPRGASNCPHCRATLFDRLRLGALGGVIGGGAIAFTLMACYGAPPCEPDDDACGPTGSSGTSGTTRDGSTDGRVLPDVQVGDGSGSSSGDANANGDGGAAIGDAATDGG